MNSISFNNFRRFEKFDPINFGGITFLVGRNNSGKSTIVKALILLVNYLKSENFHHFHFGNDILEDVNIVTYGRAKYSNAKENIIEFTCELENYFIKIEITGEDENTYANVHTLTIEDKEKGILFAFQLQNGIVKISQDTVNLIPKAQTNYIESLNKEIKDYTIELNNNINLSKKTSKNYIELVSKIENLNNKKEKLINEKKDLNQKFKQAPLFEFEVIVDPRLKLIEQINAAVTQAEIDYDIGFARLQKGLETVEKFENLKAMKEYGFDKIASTFIQFMSLVNNNSLVYMGAGSAKQSALFAIRDKKNPLAQAIHDYKQSAISSGEEEHRFVLKWMREFEIGEDISISIHAGEAYDLKIYSNNKFVQIADKGIGSIQAMLLILRMACIIRSINKAKSDLQIKRYYGKWQELNTNINFSPKTILVVEEPELNLHPALQSKLADLFLEIHKKYGIKFLIETHSEYLVRKTQLLVKENEFETKPNVNPFSVVYLNMDKTQWNINYRQDGKFIQDFGTGFFDETRNIVRKMI